MTSKEIEDAWEEVARLKKEPEAEEVREAEEEAEAEEESEEEPEAPPPPASKNMNLEATITEDLNNYLCGPKSRREANASIRHNRANESPVASRIQRSTRGANNEGVPTTKRATSNAKGLGGRKRH
jgi:hypothetical protein